MGRGEQKTVARRRCIWASGQYIAFEADNFGLADLSSQNQAFHSLVHMIVLATVLFVEFTTSMLLP
jgi:hypothetical protein